MLYIGSAALREHNLLQEDRVIGDTDVICTFQQFKVFSKHLAAKHGIVRSVPLQGGKKWHIRLNSGWNIEFEFAVKGNSSYELLLRHHAHNDLVEFEGSVVDYATPAECLMLKLSHRYLRNNPHFRKTMNDINWLRSQGVTLDDALQALLKQREKETYVYSHPKLNVSKEDFFNGDGVNYIYDHDSIHLAVALITHKRSAPCPDKMPGCMVAHYVHDPVPAYTYYMEDGAAVATSREKFFAEREEIRLYGVYEETCVLALERSQIPSGFTANPRGSFMVALEKVCTSITSGWFREYAWENYQKVVDLYEQMGEDDYIKRFNKNQHLLKPYEGDYK